MVLPRHAFSVIAPLVFLMLTLASAANACSVPVFRYALEHWQADPFRLIVFHRGPLSAQQRSQVQALGADDGAARPNISITAADVSAELSPELAEVWKREARNAILPKVVLCFPQSSGLGGTIVGMPLDQCANLNLATSPARQEMVDRFEDGQSAVWIMLESGDTPRDDAAARLLQDRLEYLMGVLTLPQLDEADIANGLISVRQEDLRLEFSLLRISRDDPKERVFISMLLGSEPDLANLREPIVFPIFGRGRALYALAGEGIRAETIDRAATFLIGKCSCQVKEQNPGMDLLLTADWESLAKGSPLLERELPDLSHLAQAAAPVTVTATPHSESKSVNGTSILIVGIFLAAAALGFWKLAPKRQ